MIRSQSASGGACRWSPCTLMTGRPSALTSTSTITVSSRGWSMAPSCSGRFNPRGQPGRAHGVTTGHLIRPLAAAPQAAPHGALLVLALRAGAGGVLGGPGVPAVIAPAQGQLRVRPWHHAAALADACLQ